MIATQLAVHLLAGTINDAPSGIDSLMKRISWGQPTNGLRLGVEISTFKLTSTNLLPYCCLYIQKIQSNESNVTYFKIPNIDSHEVRLIDATGKQFDWPEASNILRRRGGFSPGEVGKISQITCFYVNEKFPVKTNGQYQLVFSIRCCTNIAGVFGEDPVFFQFPPLTNRFEIKINDLKEQK